MWVLNLSPISQNAHRYLVMPNKSKTYGYFFKHNNIFHILAFSQVFSQSKVKKANKCA
jgi:hypothetical protein